MLTNVSFHISQSDSRQAVDPVGTISDGNTSEDNTYLFEMLRIIPLTMKQNTPKWFLMHIFSSTFSATDHLLAEVKNMLLSPEPCTLSEIEEHAFQSTLDMVYGDGWDRDKVSSSQLCYRK